MMQLTLLPDAPQQKTTDKPSPPLKWHGGKHYLADRFIELMPLHTHYVEPYFGGGAVLLAKDPIGVSEVVNDVHGDLTTFWRVLQCESTLAQFVRIIEATPFSEVEWRDAAEPSRDNVQRAVRFFVRCRQSRAGNFDSFAPLSRNRTRRGMNEQASAWITAVEGLPNVAARMKRVVILNRDALDVIRQEDRPTTLFYLDPPYLHETRVTTSDYAHEMTRENHAELLATVKACVSKVMLSGYRSNLYDRELADWNRKDFPIANNASSAKVKPKMTECVWMNY